MAYDEPVTSVGPFDLGGGAPLVFIAGPCVIESEDARPRSRARHQGGGRAAPAALRVQGLVRQGQPHVARLVSRPRARGGPAHPRPRSGRAAACPILTDIHEPDQAGAGRRSRRRPADSRVPVATDRPARRCRPHRPRRQRQEGSVPRARSTSATPSQKVRDSGNERVFVTERGTSSATTTWWSTCGRSR